MSKTIKISVSDANYNNLVTRAGGDSLKTYIRSVLFPGQIPITPADAVQRALNKYKKGDTFTVPEIYGAAWDLPNGMAGQFGKKFYKLVTEDYSLRIRFVGFTANVKGHSQLAMYEML